MHRVLRVAIARAELDVRLPVFHRAIVREETEHNARYGRDDCGHAEGAVEDVAPLCVDFGDLSGAAIVVGGCLETKSTRALRVL